MVSDANNYGFKDNIAEGGSRTLSTISHKYLATSGSCLQCWVYDIFSNKSTLCCVSLQQIL